MLKNWCASAVILASCVVGGCKSSNSQSVTPATPESQPIKAAIPADSPFAKIKEGMGSDEVFVTIGQPTSRGSYLTGKSFIPFHYGGDNHRMVARYKGQGTIIFSSNAAFSSGMSVMEINYDPNELGFEKAQ